MTLEPKHKLRPKRSKNKKEKKKNKKTKGKIGVAPCDTTGLGRNSGTWLVVYVVGIGSRF